MRIVSQNKRETSPFPGALLTLWTLHHGDWTLMITNFILQNSSTGVQHLFFQRNKELIINSLGVNDGLPDHPQLLPSVVPSKNKLITWKTYKKINPRVWGVN